MTINATDLAGNYNNTESDTITSDNTAPTLSYAVMDADNDGTNYSYIDVYFSENLDTNTVAYTDFTISRSGVSSAAIQSTSGNRVTIRFTTTFQTGFQEPKVYVNGSVTDTVGNAQTAGINVTINTFRISLSAGENLISLPCNASTDTIQEVTQNLSGTHSIWRYYAHNNSWENWVSTQPDDDFRLEAGVGYWLTVTSAQTFIGNYNLMPTGGQRSPPSVTLYAQKWNLVGHWNSFNQSASTSYGGGLASLSDSDVGSLWKYTAAGGLTNILNGAQNMEPGKGYWMFVEATSNKEYTAS